MGIDDGCEKVVLCDDDNKYKLKKIMLKGKPYLSLQETRNELLASIDCGKLVTVKFLLFAISIVLMPNTTIRRI